MLDKSLLLKIHDLMVQSRVLEERMIKIYKKVVRLIFGLEVLARKGLEFH